MPAPASSNDAGTSPGTGAQKSDDLAVLRAALGARVRQGVAMALLRRTAPRHLNRTLAYRLATSRSQGWKVRTPQSKAICTTHLTLDGLRPLDLLGRSVAPDVVTLAVLLLGCPTEACGTSMAARRVVVYALDDDTNRLHCAVRHSVPDTWDRSLRMQLALVRMQLPAEARTGMPQDASVATSISRCVAVFLAELRKQLWQHFDDSNSLRHGIPRDGGEASGKQVSSPSTGSSLLMQCAPQFRPVAGRSSPSTISTGSWHAMLADAATLATSLVPGAQFHIRGNQHAFKVQLPGTRRCSQFPSSVHARATHGSGFNPRPTTILQLDWAASSGSTGTVASARSVRFSHCWVDTAPLATDNEQSLSLHSLLGRDAYGMPRRRDGVRCGVSHRLPPLQPLPDVRWVWTFRAGSAEKRQVVVGPSCALCGDWCGSAVGLHCHALAAHEGLDVQVQMRPAPLAADLQSLSGFIQVRQIFVSLLPAICNPGAAAVAGSGPVASAGPTSHGTGAAVSDRASWRPTRAARPQGRLADLSSSETSSLSESEPDDSRNVGDTDSRRSQTRAAVARLTAPSGSPDADGRGDGCKHHESDTGASMPRLRRRSARGAAGAPARAVVSAKEQAEANQRARARQVDEIVRRSLEDVTSAGVLAPSDLGVLPGTLAEDLGVDTAGVFDARVVMEPALRPRFLPITPAAETASDVVQLAQPTFRKAASAASACSTSLPASSTLLTPPIEHRQLQAEQRRASRMAEAEGSLDVWDAEGMTRLLAPPARYDLPAALSTSSARSSSQAASHPPPRADAARSAAAGTSTDSETSSHAAKPILSAVVGATVAVWLLDSDVSEALRPQTLHPLVAWLVEGNDTAQYLQSVGRELEADPTVASNGVGGLSNTTPALGDASGEMLSANARSGGGLGAGRGKSRGTGRGGDRRRGRRQVAGDESSILPGVRQSHVLGLVSGLPGSGTSNGSSGGRTAFASGVSPLSLAAAMAAQDAGPNAMLVRPYFHSRLNTPLAPGEYDEDSDDDTNDAWTGHRSRAAIARFGDLRPAEREFMLLWNEFATRFRILSMGSSQRAALAFARAHGLTLVERGLRGCFVVHLITMWDRGLIESVAMSLALQILDSYVHTAHRLVLLAKDFWASGGEPKKPRRACDAVVSS